MAKDQLTTNQRRSGKSGRENSKNNLNFCGGAVSLRVEEKTEKEEKKIVFFQCLRGERKQKKSKFLRRSGKLTSGRGNIKCLNICGIAIRVGEETTRNSAESAVYTVGAKGNSKNSLNFCTVTVRVEAIQQK